MIATGVGMGGLALGVYVTDRRRLKRQRQESEEVLESFRKANEAHRRDMDALVRPKDGGGA
jgi:hypothetical protein